MLGSAALHATRRLDQNGRGFFPSPYLLIKEPDYERSNLFRRICRPGRRHRACGMQFLGAREAGSVDTSGDTARIRGIINGRVARVLR